MADPKHIPAGFRRRLREELALWRAEGLVSTDQADALASRYRLADLAKESSSTLLLSLYIVGALLVAGGVVSFVAAHWDGLPAAPKVALIVVAMLACHGGGFYLWKIRETHPWLGHALIVLGTLVFGANLGLMAQIFNIHSNVYNGVAAWAVGATAVAYAVGSVPNAFIAVVLSFVWLCGAEGHSAWTSVYYPLLAAVAFIPFAYRRRSAVITAMALAVIALGMIVGAPHGRWVEWRVFALVAVGAGSLYAAAGLVVLGCESLRRLGRVAVLLGAIGLGLMAYALSFLHTAEGLRYRAWDFLDSPWLISVGAAAFCSIPLWVIYALAWRKAGALRPLGAGLLACLALLAVGIGLTLAHPTDRQYYLPSSADGVDITAAVLGNIAVLALAVGLVASGMALLDRRLFWPGVLLLVILVVSRFFEYESNLMWKAAAFLVCGLGIIGGGLKFESYLRRRRAADEQP
ncbi:MAG: DUF2157 domain-containing protein [Planctomycetota bacterium]|nr:DUF2157 domain-containing protein [Planctomycetota bacterium]